MDRYLITGTSGFLGSNLAQEFIKNENNTIFGLDNFIKNSVSDFSNISSLLKNPRFNFYEKDLENNLDFSVDYIFHTLGIGDFSKYENYIYSYLNSQITNLDRILNYTKLTGSSLFLFSQINPENEMISNFITLFDNLALQFAKENKINCKILKFDYAIAPNFSNNDLRAIPSLIINALNNNEITLQNDFKLSLISITDVFNAIKYLQNNYTNENIFYLSDMYPISCSQIAQKIIQKTNSASKITFKSFEIVNNLKSVAQNIPIQLENIDIALDRAIEYAKIKYFS